MMMGYAFDDVRSELVMNSAGTDALDAITLRKGKTIAQLTTAIGVNMPTFAAVYGTKGHIDIPEFKNPTRAVLHLDGQEPVELAHPFEINGFEYGNPRSAGMRRGGQFAERAHDGTADDCGHADYG